MSPDTPSAASGGRPSALSRSTRLTVVSDPGVDDIVSLVLLERLLPETRKLLVSTFGNNSADITGINSRQFVAHVGRMWRYRAGVRLPASGNVERPWASDYHGDDGVWGAHPPASDPVRSNRYQAVSEVLSLAPLAEAYTIMRAGRVLGITLMAGAFANGPRRPEFNIAMDVRAARLFFEECAKFMPRVVPKDVTRQVRWSHADILGIPPTSTTNQWLRQMLLAWFDQYGTPRSRDFPLHDPLAVYLALNPSRAEWTRSGVAVAEGGRQHGLTTLTAANPPCEVALSIDSPDLVAREIFRIIFLT